jgi:hypothetical protein
MAHLHTAGTSIKRRQILKKEQRGGNNENSTRKKERNTETRYKERDKKEGRLKDRK